jgi:hypothetical protein
MKYPNTQTPNYPRRSLGAQVPKLASVGPRGIVFSDLGISDFFQVSRIACYVPTIGYLGIWVFGCLEAVI